MHTEIQLCGMTMPSGKRDREINLDEADDQPDIVTHNMEMMAYALSHDLRAPLRAIEGFTLALAEDLGESLPEAAAHDLREIRSGIERMHNIISKWQSLIKGNACTLQREHVDLSAMAQSIINDLRMAEPARNVMVRITPQLHAQGDAVLLYEMLQNLLGNAWKFTQQNDAQALIEFGVVVADGKHYFVRDNGIGLVDAEVDDVFRPLKRLSNASGFEGYGMGLAIVRYIAEVHGGRVWIENNPAAGAMVNFVLSTNESNDALSHLKPGCINA